MTTSHISQQQQSAIQSHHHQTIPNGRISNLSFASLNNAEKFTSDSEFVRNYGVASHTTIYPSNGIKQIVLENNRRNSISTNNNNNNGNQNGNGSNANDFDEDIIKSMKIENGINFCVFNGAFNNSSALNNHHQPERSLDVSENVSQPIGYNSINNNNNNNSSSNIVNTKQSQNSTYRDVRHDSSVDIHTAISSSTITQNSRDSPIPHSNPFTGNVRNNGSSAITTARIKTNDIMQTTSINRNHVPTNGYANTVKVLSNANTELFNGYDSRRDSRSTIDENPFFKEKISDIFVNRNVGGVGGVGGGGGGADVGIGKLYNGGSGSNNKLYISKPAEVPPNDYGHKNKAFYLHEGTKPTNADAMYANADAKVYNIFSKQRLAKSFTYDKSKNVAEENGYLAMKLPTVAAPIKQHQTQKPSQMTTQPSWDSFEDDELAKILG